MAAIPVTVTRKGPGIGGIVEIRRRLATLRRSDVLVGIPADKTLRKDDAINNASLLFIQTNGSALRNIPPRPVLEPSIAKNHKLITPHLGAAAQAVFQGEPEQAERELRVAGIVASNGAKRFFTDPGNGWPPNAPSTVEQKGSDRPLIDTGQLRRAITYVVRVDGQEKIRPAESGGALAETVEAIASDLVP